MTWIIIPNKYQSEAINVWGFSKETAACVVCSNRNIRNVSWQNQVMPSDCSPILIVAARKNRKESLAWLFEGIEGSIKIFAHFGGDLKKYKENPKGVIEKEWNELASRLCLTSIEGRDKWKVLPYSLQGGMSWWRNHLKSVSETIKAPAVNGKVDNDVSDELQKAWDEAYDEFFKQTPNENLAKILFPVYVVVSILLQNASAGNNNDEYQNSFNAVLREANTQIGSRREWGDWDDLVKQFQDLSKGTDISTLNSFCRDYEKLAKIITNSMKLS